MDEGIPIAKLETDLKFEKVRFSHDEKTSLFDDLNIIIPRGKTTFLIGPSGSGKSTLLDLLLRLYPLQGGEIRANGRNIGEFRLADWRGMIGYVDQDVYLFNATIRENILFGKPGASDEELIRIAKATKVHDFVADLPLGYDTPVGDRGVGLSGGQRQRITIARALIRNPEILILDEATSALDQDLEKELIASLKSICAGKTIIHVTHRLVAAKHADRIYVMDRGRIIRSGDYEEIFGDTDRADSIKKVLEAG